SESQPKNGRVSPLVMRSTVSASGSAASPNTITLATPKSRENAANCEMIISPPVDIIVIMPNRSQNTGVLSIERGSASFAPAVIDASADAAKQAIRQIEADQAGGAGRQHPASA